MNCNKKFPSNLNYEPKSVEPLQWRHDEHDIWCLNSSNHQPHDCLLNRLFRRRSKNTSKLRVSGLCEGNSPVNSPHKGPVTRKMFPSDDVIVRNWAPGHGTMMVNCLIFLVFYCRRHVEAGREKGAQFSVYHKGVLVVDLAGGYADDDAVLPMATDNILWLASTVKAVSAICVALLVDRYDVGYSTETNTCYDTKFCRHSGITGCYCFLFWWKTLP